MMATKRPSKTTTKASTQKLAEALILRADYKRRLDQLKARLLRNAKVQEGEKPAEDPGLLLVQLGRVSRDFEEIIQRINRTNAAKKLDSGLTISDAIAKRDVLRITHGIYRELAENATVTQDRYSKSEVKFRSTIDVAKIQKQADETAQAHRELDAQIQAANWKFDLEK